MLKFDVYEHRMKLFQIIENGAKLTDFCNYLAEQLGNPVAVRRPLKVILGKSDDYSQGLIDEFTSAEQNYDFDDASNVANMLEDVYRSRKATLSYIPYLHNKRVFCGSVYLGNRLGMIEVVARNSRPNDEEMEFIEYAASIFHIFYRLNNFVIRESKDMAMKNLLTGILDGTVNIEHQKWNMYNFSAFDVDSWRLMWLTPADKTKCLDKEFMDALQVEVEKICDSRKNWWAVSYANLDLTGFMILFEDSDREKIADIQSLCLKYNLYSVISRVFDTFAEIPRAFNDVSYMNMTFHDNKNLTPKPGIRYYENYKIGIALNEMFYNVDKDILGNPLIDEIYNYDRVHNTGYYDTLECYFMNNGDFDVMSEILNVHKNTIAYRMKKISEIFKINFKSFRETADLFYSMQFNRKKDNYNREPVWHYEQEQEGSVKMSNAEKKQKNDQK